jgi:hypothetical protein
MKEKNCKQRIGSAWRGRKGDLLDLYKRMSSDDFNKTESAAEELANYGLSLDFIVPENGRPFWAWVFGTGGPHDEIRIYGTVLGEYKVLIDRLDYVFKDWFDHAAIRVRSEKVKELICNEFVETGTLSYLAKKEGENV